MLTIARHFLSLLAALIAFAVTMLGGVSEVAAAPIGMCGETAQSVPAPPPMFPASDAVLKNCNAEGEQEFDAQHRGAPAERVSSSMETPDQEVVLHPLPVTVRAKSFRLPLSKATATRAQEHRWRGLRPPCS